MSLDDSILPTNYVQTVSGARMLAQESVRGAEELFIAIVEAEERELLVKGLLDRGVGVPSVEWYHRKQTEACRVQKNKKTQIKIYFK